MIDTQQLQQKYEIQGDGVSGSFGTVYRARQKNNGLEVALKVLDPLEGESLEKLYERHQRESRVLATLYHPNIIQIVDSGVDGGEYYVASKWVESTLEGLVRSSGTPMDVSVVKSIALDVLEALKYAHNEGVIHGDIKPSNIFIDGDGKVKVGDWGMAKYVKQVLGGSSGRYVSRSDSTILPNTDYTAPEVKRGLIYPASDLFSLGIIINEMFTGSTIRDPYNCGKLEEVVRMATEPKHFKRNQSTSEMKNLILSNYRDSNYRLRGKGIVDNPYKVHRSNLEDRSYQSSSAEITAKAIDGKATVKGKGYKAEAKGKKGKVKIKDGGNGVNIIAKGGGDSNHNYQNPDLRNWVESQIGVSRISRNEFSDLESIINMLSPNLPNPVPLQSANINSESRIRDNHNLDVPPHYHSTKSQSNLSLGEKLYESFMFGVIYAGMNFGTYMIGKMWYDAGNLNIVTTHLLAALFSLTPALTAVAHIGIGGDTDLYQNNDSKFSNFGISVFADSIVRMGLSLFMLDNLFDYIK